MTITGDGLGVTSLNDVSVKFGNNTCRPLTATGTTITCMTSHVMTTHLINNNGHHPGILSIVFMFFICMRCLNVFYFGTQTECVH